MSNKNLRAVKINGKSIRVNPYFLDALSMKYFDKKYEDNITDTNKKLQDIFKNHTELSPQIVEQEIFSIFLPKKLKNGLK